MKRIVFSFLALLVAVASAEAKYWKIGPGSVEGMNFTSINAAMSSSLVSAGDTLYLDQYYNESADQNVTKAVVIIGTGYDTSFTDEQVVARLTGYLNLKADNVVVKSVCLCYVYLYNTNCTLDRCYSIGIYVKSTTAGLNHVYSCYVLGPISGYDTSNYSKMDIQNCVITYNNSNSNLRYLTLSVINNNVIYKQIGYSGSIYCLQGIKNSQITNNFVYCYNTGSSGASTWSDMSSDVYASGSGNSIEHNIFSKSYTLTYYPNNKTGYRDSWTSFFVCTGTYSNYYRLKTTNNFALTYATDGGEVGCHGGLFGCPSGGRPQYVPYFTKVVVGSRTENGKLPVSVNIKIQDE